MAEKIETGGAAFPMQDPVAIHAYATARIAHMGGEPGEERERAYVAARAEAVGGMNLRQYAAIKLRVPNSGTDWLDAMIVEAKRDELAAKASQAAIKRVNAQAGHTPGPWVMDDAQPGDLFRHVLHGNGDSFGYICRISTNGNANADADARLIAAAPELLRALIAMLDAYEMPSVRASARAAIAKALGDTP